MAVVVQKYGGTSVGDINRIKNVANRVKATRNEGNDVLVVVSARSGVTNRLVSEAKTLHENPDEREMDMLLTVGEQETIALTAIALHALDVPAVSRTGGQAGIITDHEHTRARILKIDGHDLRDQLAKGKVVIVAGFQGVNKEGQTTTLGRGGSDLSAIALAVAIKADLCQIFTDVEGVYTADPRVVPNARKMDVITYDEMLELASSGSKVMQPRAVEFAYKYGINFEIRSSFNNNTGTMVKGEMESMEDVVVRGVAVDKNQAKIIVSGLPDVPGSTAKVFNALADANVNVDMIVQNIARAGKANLTFTVSLDDTSRAKKAVSGILDSISRSSVKIIGNIAKLSVVGVGMRSHSGIAATLFSALAKSNINIQLISTSEIKISVAIDLDKADEACRVVHQAFDLDKS